jgi:hypothetical protein
MQGTGCFISPLLTVRACQHDNNDPRLFVFCRHNQSKGISRMPRVTNLVQLFDRLTGEERIIVDVLRQVIIETLPSWCKEKLSFNVPYFYGNRGICIIWPASIPRGGIKSGVLLGFWHGNKLKDEDHYLVRGSNKQVYYKIYRSPEEIDEKAIVKLLLEAIKYDQSMKTS